MMPDLKLRRRWERLTSVHVVAHLLRALERYNTRLGGQLAAGIAYHSVVSIVPVVMVLFSILGFMLTVVYPQWLVGLTQSIRDVLSNSPELADAILTVIEPALHGWAALSIVGLLVAIWSGSSWMGALKRGVRVQLRAELGKPEERLPLPLDLVANLGILLLFFSGVAVTFLAMWLTVSLGAQLGVPKTISLLVSMVAGTLLFAMLLWLFSIDPLPRRAVLEGSIVGAVGLGVLQLAATGLISVLSQNISYATFGSVIVLMVFMNLFAQLILLVAAWVGTWERRPRRPRPATTIPSRIPRSPRRSRHPRSAPKDPSSAPEQPSPKTPGAV
jgi:membrane protein